MILDEVILSMWFCNLLVLTWPSVGTFALVVPVGPPPSSCPRCAGHGPNQRPRTRTRLVSAECLVNIHTCSSASLPGEIPRGVRATSGAPREPLKLHVQPPGGLHKGPPEYQHPGLRVEVSVPRRPHCSLPGGWEPRLLEFSVSVHALCAGNAPLWPGRRGR